RPLGQPERASGSGTTPARNRPQFGMALGQQDGNFGAGSERVILRPGAAAPARAASLGDPTLPADTVPAAMCDYHRPSMSAECDAYAGSGRPHGCRGSGRVLVSIT